MAIYACGKVQLWCAAMALLEDSAIYLVPSHVDPGGAAAQLSELQ